MLATDLQRAVTATSEYQRVLALVGARETVYVNGAVGSLAAVFIASLYADCARTILCVSSSEEGAQTLAEDLSAQVHRSGRVCVFPAIRVLPWGHRDRQSVSQQMETVERLLAAEPILITSSVEAISSALLPLASVRRERFVLRTGDACARDELLARLAALGFERQPLVQAPGEFSLRGGIVDLYPFSRPNPLRIEFFGHTVESLREFDPRTQRSLAEAEQIVLFPQKLEPHAEDEAGAEHGQLKDYLPANSIVCFLEHEKLIAQAEASGRDEADAEINWLAEGRGNSECQTSRSLPDFSEQLSVFCQVCFRQFATAQCSVGMVRVPAQPQPALKGTLSLLRQEMANFLRSSPNGKIYFVCESSPHAESMQNLFEESDIVFPQLRVTAGGLAAGFQWSAAGLAVYTDHEFYGRMQRLPRRRRFSEGLSRRQLKTLARGDYVVHIDHGVGIFQGLERIRVRGHESECLAIAYLDNDRLFVPVEKMDRVQKYSGREGFVPRIHKLGSSDWERTKRRTKNRLRDIAKDLVALYAARQAQTGHAFARDSHWQREMEASFPYEDTPDQRRAALEVKSDMEKSRPMERLVCGDVGYGKTEVAIRAAFKAAQDGKQVAVLVPTTILAQQHYGTFRERLCSYPLQIELLSRFRTQAEQRVTINKLKSGEIDVVIGTHRLLSKDVGFKDLGLLVIDEEQLFGVRSKERLKQVRLNVDVLTLSATPIPRTLHMALLGMRDMSAINTPPRDRLPIATEVVEFNRELIRQAVQREVQRGGQVFFVHNRIQTIDRVAVMLSALLPVVRMGIAHGQMKERELEKVMLDFLQRRFDVLISTMIIESGLDLPNVNTIIVNRADRFGLSQLYQLRGRVGRSSQKAYCYLLIPPLRDLTPAALKRLQTIEEFTELGSGFQIAMRDLEIRGAGSLLGAEQSGFIASLGFELYCKTLEEAVNEVQQAVSVPATTAEEKLPECKVELDEDAFLPEDYVALAAERVDIYRRLAEAQEGAELDRVRDELRDRFGRLPEPAESLLALVKLRVLGKKAGLRSLHVSSRQMVGYFAEDNTNGRREQFLQWLGSMVQHATGPFDFLQDTGVGFRVALSGHAQAMPDAERFLESLVAARTTMQEAAAERWEKTSA